MAHQLAIRGGTLIDGTGSVRRRADIGIDGGRIVEIGETVRGADELDASGALVTPGFIDLHTHYDAQVLWDPFLTSSSLQGVTSVASGSCGFSLAPCPAEMRDLMMRTFEFVEGMDRATLAEGIQWGWETFPEYLEQVASTGTAINYGAYVGHTAVRLAVMGEQGYEREATRAEIEAMRLVVRDAVLAGALGFSTDRSPYHRGDRGRRVPSALGSEHEVLTLMGAVGEVGHGVCMAIVDPIDFEWVFDAQASIGRPLNWCQLMTWPENSRWLPSTSRQLERQRLATGMGMPIYGQATCKPVTQQITFSNPIPLYPAPAFGETAALGSEGRKQRYRDQQWRQRARADLVAYNDPDWTKWIVAETQNHPALVGRTIAELAKQDGKAALDAALDLALEDDLQTRFTVISANDNFEELASILTSDGCILGLSDAGAHCDQMCDANMQTDFLANWVRDKALMPLEAGIRKVTGEPASVLELHDRGTVEVGQAADIAVWDLEALDPGPMRRVDDFPAGGSRLVADRPDGFWHVLVNGTPIRRDTVSLLGDLSSLPGQVLRSC
jgi:N-acyl-D-amino-acid deacylase